MRVRLAIVLGTWNMLTAYGLRSSRARHGRFTRSVPVTLPNGRRLHARGLIAISETLIFRPIFRG
ncbi:uncharacterized protein K460DRAFT_370104 [Cucurbitaria berberidis CBS 394.84]|uniref:Uncharacterized protein n=1 Tax=Cucurbitaria berberidis CBS 394.84 TaxID=1168544 RepID=A0A9P4GAB7_9PLEO|nr:uncharacterized protein K460DRAFT_370104 [Cucurbitaria berberidis CBS 394.84]KAF1842103.1 hypothetical protein K460DRAFT_370104 [Cucurbitaria berberidis CBS 394.84]